MSRTGVKPLLHAKIHCSVQDNELRIFPIDDTPDTDHRHTRLSIEGILLNCCSTSTTFKAITVSLYNVLSAESYANELRIHCVDYHRKKVPVRTFLVKCSSAAECESFVESIWKASYRDLQPRKRIKVLLNPFGGAGKAKAIWEDYVAHIFEAAKYTIDLEETQYSSHATEIAREISYDSYDAIVCVSGDGIPHEVINGLGSRPDAQKALRLPIAFIPAGSGNGSAKSIYDNHKHAECALAIIKGIVTPIDLISITQGDRHFLSYFSISYGVIADCDLGTEHLRWMGESRFTFGVVQRILTRTRYPCTLSLSVATADKDEIRRQYHERKSIAGDHYSQLASNPFDHGTDPVSQGLPKLRFGTVNDPVPKSWLTKRFPDMGTFYAGLMPYMSSSACFFPTASPANGHIDVMHIQADLPFFSALNTVAAVDTAKHFESPYCFYAKCDAFRLVPDGKSGYISVDGERVPFAPLQGEIHHALGRIITKNGQYYSQFSE